MSFRSERRIRSVIVASTGLSLLGVVSVFVDFGTTNGFFAMSGHAGGFTASARQPSKPVDSVTALPPQSERLFRPGSGKQDRADLAPARHERPQIVAASMVSMPAALSPNADSTQQDVNRGAKGDRLPPPMTVAKFTVPAQDQVNVHASAAVFLVSPPLADASGNDGNLSRPPVQTAVTRSVEVHGTETTAATAGPVDNDQLAPTDRRPGGKSYWDDLVKMAAIRGDDTKGEKPVFFGGLTEKEEQARQLRCMATAIYFEARDEPLRGQIAVAQVIMNRLKSEFYPKTICEVIYQGSQNRNACQFSFACDGKADAVHEKEEWAHSLDVARQIISGKVYLTDIGDATHYHATYVHPEWRKQIRKIKQIGTHIFYKADFAPPLIANAEYNKL